MRKPFLILALCLSLPAVSAIAQDAGAPPGVAAQTAPAVDSADLEARTALALKMHEIKPINFQVEEVIKQMSQRFPDDKRDLFVTRMLEVFDKQSLTDISVRAMAETFTVAELQKMVDFHGSAEGRAISEKMPVYQTLVQPELIKKIDAAMLEVRTGGGSEVAPSKPSPPPAGGAPAP